MIDRLRGDDLTTTLRRGLLALAVLGIAGTTIELVFLRHWSSPTRLIVWPAIIALGIGLLLVAHRPSPGRVTAARGLAVMVLVIAVLGVAFHVHGNLEAGPLDKDYAAIWASMSAIEQWWLAITGGVGPAPVLAPGVLGEISLGLLLATVAHPASARSPVPAMTVARRLDEPST